MYYYENKNPELIEYLKSGNLLNVRLVNIVLPTGEIETLITNLSEIEMTYEELNELYRLRWGIENSYHYLKESMKIETITSSNEDIIKQYLIYILLEDDDKLRDLYMSILYEKILKHIVPIRPNRKYERKKDVKNKHRINKRKTF